MFVRTAASIAVFVLAGCSDSPDSSTTFSGLNAKTEVSDTQEAGQVSNSRVILINSTDDASSIEAALESLSAAEQGVTIPADPIVQTVLPDGTLVFDVGNRFVRPLFATVDCSGKVKSSHDNVGTTGIGKCQQQRGKKQ